MFCCTLHTFKSPEIKLYHGMVVTHSCRVSPGTYHLSSEGLTRSVIRIQGDHIKVDFTGVNLVGDQLTTAPDRRKGVGVEMSGKNITIVGLHVRGYQCGIIAHKCDKLKLIDCDFSWNYKQHLGSTLAREDENDWQSFHHNEHDEWYRYGAGAYLKQSSDFEIRNCTGTGEQCGLDLVKSDFGLVWNSNFSFNSGLGIGMYRSSHNRIMHNKMDWDVRGYSYGVYNRGQDSAGILLFEQCNRNMIAYNSITHGGDGFFLWAGQTTMDSGRDGCNDNLVYGNDFSGAITNGIEATFSRNLFLNNLVVECDNGFWGGYSYDSIIKDNIFALCNTGCSVEHGQNNNYQGNLFQNDKVGISIWAHPVTDPTWGYPKYRDIRSTNLVVLNDRFIDCVPQSLNVTETSGILLASDSFIGSAPILIGAKTTGLKEMMNAQLANPHPQNKAVKTWLQAKQEYPGNVSAYICALHWNPLAAKSPFVHPLEGGMNPFLNPATFRGRRSVLVGEWGPYDFKYPKFWCWNGPSVPTNRVLELKVLGPKGNYVVNSISGASLISGGTGSVPGTVKVLVGEGNESAIKVSATYSGAETIDEFGHSSPVETPIHFSYIQDIFLLNWTLDYFQWNEASSPLKHLEAFEAQLAEKPLFVQHVSTINYGYSNGWPPSLPNNHYAVVAHTVLHSNSGIYKLSLTGDDGVRCFLDGKLVPMIGPDGKITDSFIYQGATTYTSNLHLSAGDHQLRVEYFQIDGGRAFEVTLMPIN